MANSTKIHKRARQLKGQPVLVTLHDGRSYMGWISGLEKEALILSKPHRKTKSARGSHSPSRSCSRSQKAEVSGLFPLLGSFLGGSGAGAAAGAAGAASAGSAGFGGLGFLGMFQKVMPMMKMGYSMIKSIRPLLGGLKSFMG